MAMPLGAKTTPAVTSQPKSKTVKAPAKASFQVKVASRATPTYQWQVSTDGGSSWTAVTKGSGGATRRYTTAATTSGDHGQRYRVVVATDQGPIISASATLKVKATPSISVHPVDQQVPVGQGATFSAVASGYPAPKYQWQVSLDGGKRWSQVRSGTGRTAASYTTAAATPASEGQRYRVLVTNKVGRVASAAAVLRIRTAPIIVTQPMDRTVIAPAPATFTVSAQGYPAAMYQWQVLNGDTWADVSTGTGGTTASYTTAATRPSDHGKQFRVVVTDGRGRVTSRVATLNVSTPPVIATAPQNITVSEGQTATFTVVASGTPPLVYQWRKNGVVIPGATSNRYTTPATKTSDSGSVFSASVSNASGSATSANATLTVNNALPSIAFSASPASLSPGQSSTLSWTLTNTTQARIEGMGAIAVPSGSLSVSPTATTTYTLTAIGPGGTHSATVTISLVTHSITIHEEDGKSTTDYPVQIGRPFLPGEIRDYPQAVVDGIAVTTQADVKQRYPDGSVKHAILSFLIPSFPASSTAVVSFQNQTTGLNDQPLSASDMLEAAFNFDAAIELTHGSTVAASARQMLQDGKFVYWLRGPVATSLILADHSQSRAYDMGFDGHRSFRPIFHATFWPKIHKVHVRIIGEAAHTEAIQDLQYDLKLSLGQAPSQQVYARSAMTHHALSRWTKDDWIGGAPSKVSINHNLAYLKETKLLPNFDTRKTIPESEIQARYSTWLPKPKDLYDAGWWTKGMGTTGGRPDIGIYPTWTVQWLYTGDWRMADIAFKQGELSGAWGIHLREGNATKFLDKAHTVPGLGFPMTASSRPTMKAGDWANYKVKAEDKCTLVGPMTNGGWLPDNAHVADFSSAIYLLTGDYWYLEEMYFWTAYAVTSAIGYDTGAIWGRGPTGKEGGIYDQVRGQAWVFRNRIHTHAVAPDGDPFKAWLGDMITDAIAVWDGGHDVADSTLKTHPCWKWGRDRYGADGLSPLHMWTRGSELTAQGGVNTMIDGTKAKRFVAPWMQHFLLMTLGRAEELGYPAGPIKRWFGVNLANELTHTSYSPYLAAAYVCPTTHADDTWLTDWAQVKDAFFPTYVANATQFASPSDAEHGYSNIALAASSFIKDVPQGAAAWTFMELNALPDPSLTKNPKWALIPRH